MRDLISLESSSTSGSNYSQGGLLLLTMTGVGRSNYPEPQILRLKNCVLKKPLMQFPVGTKFDEIALNENNVMYFYIYDAKRQHALDRPGYEYLGHWSIMLQFGEGEGQEITAKNIYTVLYRKETQATQKGFEFEECTAACDIGPLKEGTAFENATFDIVNGAFSITTTDSGAFGGRMLIRFNLNAREIALDYLDKAVEEGMIAERDCEERKRIGYKMEMPNPLPCSTSSSHSLSTTSDKEKAIEEKGKGKRRKKRRTAK